LISFATVVVWIVISYAWSATHQRDGQRRRPLAATRSMWRASSRTLCGLSILSCGI